LQKKKKKKDFHFPCLSLVGQTSSVAQTWLGQHCYFRDVQRNRAIFWYTFWRINLSKAYLLSGRII